MDKTSRRLKILDDKFLKKPFYSQMIYTLISAIPKDVQINLLDFKETGDFSLKGSANNISNVFSILESLNNSGIFLDAKIKYASQEKRKAKTAVEFYIHGKTRL